MYTYVTIRRVESQLKVPCTLPKFWPVYRPVSYLCPCDWPKYGLSGLSKIWPGASHRPGIDQFIGDHFANRVKSNSMPARLPKMTRQLQGVPWGPGRKCLEIRRKLLANPSQANCDRDINSGPLAKCQLK